jgi:hypothetical protein
LLRLTVRVTSVTLGRRRRMVRITAKMTTSATSMIVLT